MGGIRIRWRGVARVAAIVLVGLIVLRLAPGFLQAPEPPPLAADVGLPQATPATKVPREGVAKPVTDVPGRRAASRPARPARPARPRERRRRSRPAKSRPGHAEDAPASSAVIGSGRRHRVVAKPASHPTRVVESPPAPAPEYVPPTVPEPVPEYLPEPSPAPPPTPGDGSEEFAPH
jgi:hypothetical protein